MDLIWIILFCLIMSLCAFVLGWVIGCDVYAKKLLNHTIFKPDTFEEGNRVETKDGVYMFTENQTGDVYERLWVNPWSHLKYPKKQAKEVNKLKSS